MPLGAPGTRSQPNGLGDVEQGKAVQQVVAALVGGHPGLDRLGGVPALERAGGRSPLVPQLGIMRPSTKAFVQVSGL